MTETAPYKVRSTHLQRDAFLYGVWGAIVGKFTALLIYLTEIQRKLGFLKNSVMACNHELKHTERMDEQQPPSGITVEDWQATQESVAPAGSAHPLAPGGVDT
jgi:hypothetical protein